MEEQVPKIKLKDKTSRERQTFFRVTFNTNSQLLKIADNKANIVISINALVISSMVALVGYGSVSQQLDMQNFVMLIPIKLFIIMSLISTVLAIQAAKPKIVGKTDNLSEGKRSLIFFGSVSHFEKDEYIQKIHEAMASRDAIMDQMSASLYYQSQVLNKKYKLLRQAYQVFMFGLIIGVFAFLLQLIK
jgi:hypothetical protein